VSERTEIERRKEVALQKLRPLVCKELDKMLDAALENLEDDAEGFLIEAGFDPGEIETDEEIDEWAGLIDEILGEAAKYWHGSAHGPVWALISFNPERGIYGLDLEFFGSRPRTGSTPAENWPEWFRVYEGNLDGGDSAIVDRRGANFG